MKDEGISVVADSNGWQKKCWELAMAQKEFTVLEFSETNLPFIDALAAAYRYKCSKKRQGMVLVPELANRDGITITDGNDRPDSKIAPARPLEFAFEQVRSFAFKTTGSTTLSRRYENFIELLARYCRSAQRSGNEGSARNNLDDRECAASRLPKL
jgi:hypothetical protein